MHRFTDCQRYLPIVTFNLKIVNPISIKHVESEVKKIITKLLQLTNSKQLVNDLFKHSSIRIVMTLRNILQS